MQVNVVFHIDESEKWGLLLGNVQNLLRELAPEGSRVEVVANAGAVQQYVNGGPAPLLSAMRDLAAEGVVFAACRNALRGLGIPPEQLAPFVRVVPAGVLELARLQAEGCAYIRP